MRSVSISMSLYHHNSSCLHVDVQTALTEALCFWLCVFMAFHRSLVWPLKGTLSPIHPQPLSLESSDLYAEALNVKSAANARFYTPEEGWGEPKPAHALQKKNTKTNNSSGHHALISTYANSSMGTVRRAPAEPRSPRPHRRIFEAVMFFFSPRSWTYAG